MRSESPPPQGTIVPAGTALDRPLDASSPALSQQLANQAHTLRDLLAQPSTPPEQAPAPANPLASPMQLLHASAGSGGQPQSDVPQDPATPSGPAVRPLQELPAPTEDQGPHGVDTPQRNAPAPSEAMADNLTRPFDLFHTVSMARAPDAVEQLAGSAALQHTLLAMATRLLVADGSQGRRSVQIELAEAQLPGVVVDVFEDAGRLVTRFTCSQEASRERLCAGAPWFADSLVQHLQRDARVEVRTDDPEDPCLLQVDADC